MGDAVSVSRCGACGGAVVTGTVGAVFMVDTFLPEVSVFLAFIVSKQFLNVLAYYNSGIGNEHGFLYEFVGLMSR